ncbi:hypothetical protein HNP52_000285 [Sphingomonas kyeonggiensis]|uniref:Uncharacterized protein n=1 Tax=Sphingomonas kyeonggiensis TaxID=1268553 RepID=A0A7W7JXU4_9SPHN|nr:contractile injection system tape measure protein [Sphingomonas kyeonggiensis]MBB4837234.1 hypothetical protein [Sphingomonas kyeonggiensis]
MPTDRLVGEAGLVLFTPYLPALFNRIGVLAGDPQRVAPAELGRAVAMLRYLATHSEQAGDPALPLILCGSAPDADVPAVELAEDDRAMAETIIASLIANWPAIRSTSPQGLREAFLQRQGQLSLRGEGGWQLKVQRKALDVLVDQVPWSFTTVLHRWMPGPVQVVW